MRVAWRRLFTSRRTTMSTSYYDVPPGVRLLQRFKQPTEKQYKISVFVITYLAYVCYHMTRKSISVVKAVLENCTVPAHANEGVTFIITNHNDPPADCGYPPFNGKDADHLFGLLDTSFLLAYAVAMFVSGYIAERVSLRYFLSLGMLGSAFFCYLFGVAKTANIHSMAYFIFIQIMAGIFQTTGWPSVVPIVGRWFGKGNRGLLFGVWNSHTSIGNVLGTVIPAAYIFTDWSRSFIVPGFIMGVMGFFVYLFLVDSPEVVGCQPRPEPSPSISGDYRPVDQQDSDGSYTDDTNIVIGHQEVTSRASASERTTLLNHDHPVSEEAPIGFWRALKIPGVIDFSMCLFFTKLVSYTFLFWLPMYINKTTNLDAEASARLSTTFDYGGILGAIAAGALADYTQKPATTCAALLTVAIPTLLVYVFWGHVNLAVNYILLFVVGSMVNGPYALITTSVSAELGQHPSLGGNDKAMAAVTAIIDGTGSFGAAVGPALAGVIVQYGWNSVIYMVALAELIAIFLLIRLVKREFEPLRRNVRIE